MKPLPGFEPGYTAYKAVVLPLDDEGVYYSENTSNIDTLSDSYGLNPFPHTFRYVRIMRAFLKEAVPFSSEILDLLFGLIRVVRSLIMLTFSIKSLRLASSTIPCYVSATDLTHFLPEPLPTFAFWSQLRGSNPQLPVLHTGALPVELNRRLLK